MKPKEAINLIINSTTWQKNDLPIVVLNKLIKENEELRKEIEKLNGKTYSK